MQHTGLRQGRLAQQRQGVGAGGAGMHDDRLAAGFRRIQMQTEGALLQLGRFRLVVIVQPGFADRHHAGVFEFLQQPVERRLGAGFEVQWMHADRAIDIRVALGQRLYRSGIVGTDANAEKMPDAALARSLQRGIEGALMSGKIEPIEMTVRIYQH